MRHCLLYVFTILSYISVYSQINYIENFESVGVPINIPNGSYWKYFNDIHPNQNTWEQFIPGDGFAYIKVDADIHNDKEVTYPYQTMVFGGIYENHRIETRMKGAVVDGGLVGFLFTYGENQIGTVFNEVDIEVVANDRDVEDHDRHPPHGWTDARFNTWRNASTTTYLPISGSAKPVRDGNDNKISLIDDEFHNYTIDWRSDQVVFFIDGVFQESFSTNVATAWGEVIIGFRNLPWARDFNWTGTHHLIIDYLKIEPLSSLSITSNNLKQNKLVTVFPNPAQNRVNIICKDFYNIKFIEIINSIGQKVLKTSTFQNKVNISTLPKGVYVVNTHFKDGFIVSKKIVKL